MIFCKDCATLFEGRECPECGALNPPHSRAKFDNKPRQSTTEVGPKTNVQIYPSKQKQAARGQKKPPRSTVASPDGKSSLKAVDLSSAVQQGTQAEHHNVRDLLTVFLAIFGFMILVALGFGIYYLSRQKTETVEDHQPNIIISQPKKEESPSTPPGMIYIEGGDFIMGSNVGDPLERPPHSVHVAPFYIDAKEVTCEQYQKFIEATRYRAPAGWTNGQYPLGAAELPVTGVDWYAAKAYAEWDQKRLPEEKEWEFAARGSKGQRYPWGNDWDSHAANAGTTSQGHIVPVGQYEAGKTPSGIYDLIGNVWEWTATTIEAYPGGGPFQSEKPNMKVIRGGAYDSDISQATATFRGYWYAQGSDYGKTGFRCAKSAP